MFALGCLSGVTTVLFGFGGGFVTVPVVYAVAASGPDAMHVAVGAGIGALAATEVPDGWLHLFAVYLGVTIVDSVVRRGFVRAGAVRPLGPVTTTAGGVGIGAVVSFLGVGGSVMTVPLLRRRGLPLADTAVMANPLSLPVAVVALLVYLTVPGTTGFGAVDPLAATALLAGSLPTVAAARRWLPPIPDRAHALAYIGLLIAALVAVLAGGL
nr:sulfite exporter TauE/SafE family protein [Kibdelosporangium phytohabitans]